MKVKKFITALLLSALLSVLTGALGFAQGGYKVKGVVIDQTGPVIGATVMEANSSNGVTTGVDGDFALTVRNSSATVEISCIGYKTLSFRASELPAKVVLAEDTEILDETVVIGYGTVKKSDMTGSVSTVKTDEISRAAVNTPDQLVLGKVAGLRIIPGYGQDNSVGTIRIRGTASLSASNDPLIVIDGVVGGSLNSVNPNDIDSFSVLKDASATAIYGSRASNGVIIITTKKGVGTKPQVSYSGSFSVKSLDNFYEWMDGDELRAFINKTYPEKSHLLGTANTDFMDMVYRPAINTDHNISIRQGGKWPYRVSMGYNHNEPNSKVGNSERAMLNATLSPKFLDEHLSVNVNLKASYNYSVSSKTGAIGGALSYNPTSPAYESDGKTIWNWRNPDGSALDQAPYSPLSQLYDGVGWNNSARVSGALQLDYKVHRLEDLSLHANLSYNTSYGQGKSWNLLDSYSYQRSTNPTASKNAGWGGKTKLLEVYADYNHKFRTSRLDAMVGYSWQHFYNHSRGSETYYHKGEELFKPEDIYQEAIPSSSELYLISFYGRINWTLLDRYLFTFTLRDDASSRFSPSNRWGLFPAAAFAWNMKEESFLKGARSLSSLKLRLGWGRTGQQDIGGDYYAYLARYNRSTSDVAMLYNMGDGMLMHTLAPSGYNPNIKWETTETWNVGVDFGFIKERLTGTVEAYYRRTFDLLNSINVPLGSNFSNVITSNIGSMVNKGIEVSLNARIIENRTWNWTVNLNATFQDTKITKLTAFESDDYLGVQTGDGLGGKGGYSALHAVGHAPNSFYLYQQLYDPDGNPVQNGLVDRNGDGVVNDSDRYLTDYSPNPWMFCGFSTSLRYKKWDFSINGHGSFGNHVINTARSGAASTYKSDYTYGYLDNINKELMIPGWVNANTVEQSYSDFWIENASFFKIDDINLGYTFSFKSALKSLRLAFSVQNVATMTKFKGLDPEVTSMTGVNGSSYPRPRIYTLRLNLNF